MQRRLDLWLAQHIKKLLGPLIELETGEGLEGIARGIAFQVAEALGVLERSRVAEEMKSLDQAARGTLRKLGLRFGAYHIYLPALVKPAPRALAAQLWALAPRRGRDHQGARRGAASGGLGPNLLSRPTRTCPRASTAPRASGSAASAPCGSISWSGWPI